MTHIVGLRPFGSQLLCDQVVGRALRRKSYALNEESQMFAEETAQVFGVPFELIPFKVSPAGPIPPTPEPNHIYSVPAKAEFEITLPRCHRSGFDPYARVISSMTANQNADLFWNCGALTPPESAASIVDDADRRHLLRNVQPDKASHR